MSLNSISISQTFQSIAYQFKQAWLGIRQKSGFISSIVLTMGLTLGALLCVLTLSYLMLYQPLPYPDQERLYWVEHNLNDDKGANRAGAFSYPGLVHFYKHQTTFDQSAMLMFSKDILISDAQQPTMNTTYITPEYFSLLDTPMALGRKLNQEEGNGSFIPVAMISYQMWQTEFDGNADILDKKLSFNQVSFRIIGVTAANFIEPELAEIGRKTQVWLPWDYNSLRSGYENAWGNVRYELAFVGKLATKFSEAQARRSISPFLNELWQGNVTEFDFYQGWQVVMDLTTFKSRILGDSEQRLYLLLGSIVGLLLIASANISNLFISRMAEQQKPLAIRAALGATKKQLFNSLFVESFILMSYSVVIALIIAWLGFYLLQSQLEMFLPRISELSLNLFTLSVALFLVFCFALFLAKLSSKMINYQALNHGLQSSGKGSGIQVSKRVRQLLIISQVAIATSLVFINLSLFDEAITEITTPSGYNIDDVIAIELSADTSLPRGGDESIALLSQIREQFKLLPSVRTVSQSSTPMGSYTSTLTNIKTDENYDVELLRGIDNKYFTLLNVVLLTGDFFTAQDIISKKEIIIINDVFAKALVGVNGSIDDVIGLKIKVLGNSDEQTVVGVVKGGNIPNVAFEPMQSYHPTWRASSNTLIKLNEGASLSREQVVNAIKAVTSKYTIFEINSLSDIRQQMLFSQYTTVVTTLVLTLLTLFLAAIGLYGVLSYSTQMRRFEIGTRMAIGAKKLDLIALIIKENTRSIVLGIFFSGLILLVLSLSFSAVVESYLTLQLITAFLGTLCLVILISVIACYLPLRQYINQPAIHSLKGSE
ncbi:MAG: ABC transporter permease [Colwellia sp.]|nr:ABC transporter permease [Colwellia sp.]